MALTDASRVPGVSSEPRMALATPVQRCRGRARCSGGAGRTRRQRVGAEAEAGVGITPQGMNGRKECTGCSLEHRGRPVFKSLCHAGEHRTKRCPRHHADAPLTRHLVCEQLRRHAAGSRQRGGRRAVGSAAVQRRRHVRLHLLAAARVQQAGPPGGAQQVGGGRSAAVQPVAGAPGVVQVDLGGVGREHEGGHTHRWARCC